MVLEIRKEKTKTGTVKLHQELKPMLKEKNIKFGRKKLKQLINTLILQLWQKLKNQ